MAARNRLLIGIFFTCGVTFLLIRHSPAPPPVPEELSQAQLQQVWSQLERSNQLHQLYKTELARLREQMHAFMHAQGGSLLSNTTLESSSLSHLLSYLPPDGLQPAHVLSRGRSDVTLAIGIPTIKREKTSYLEQTIKSLLAGLTEDDITDVVIVVMIAELEDMHWVNETMHALQALFAEQFASGLLEVVVPKRTFYPDLSTLKPTFGDAPDRVKWRTKQVLDFCYLMMYCRSRAVYYLQLEDDVVTKPNYVQVIKQFVLSQRSSEWVMLEFTTLGFIGKLFRSLDLYKLVDFFLIFYRDKPVDWLLDDFLSTKICSPEHDAKNCQKQKSALRRPFKPALFQHVGMHSSLKGKVQKLTDRTFGKAQVFVPHDNPPARVETTLKVYQQNDLAKAYLGQGVFWALNPQPEDTVTLEFTPAIIIERYLFQSGNVEHGDDKFHDTIVEVRPQAMNDKWKTAYPSSATGWLNVGAFELGVAKGNVTVEEAVSAVRLRVLKESEFWVLISEIHIKAKS